MLCGNSYTARLHEPGSPYVCKRIVGVGLQRLQSLSYCVTSCNPLQFAHGRTILVAKFNQRIGGQLLNNEI